MTDLSDSVESSWHGETHTTAPEPEAIMVVDDEPSLRRFLSRAIDSAGYRTQAFPTAEEAVEALAASTYSVVLADIRMPGHGGIWLLEQVQRVSPDTAVVMVTADDDSRTAVECLTRGAVDYLIKPVDMAELLEVITKAVHGRRLRIENIAIRATMEAYREVLYRVAAGHELSSGGSGLHGCRVAVYSYLLAAAVGCRPQFRRQILYAAPLHDLGNGGMGADGPMHAAIGAWMLAPSVSNVVELGRAIALTHHERFDGKGVPQGLRGEQIPLGARITAIADAFDKAVAPYPGGRALASMQAVELIERGKGTEFDPTLVEAVAKGRPILEAMTFWLAAHAGRLDVGAAQTAAPSLSDLLERGAIEADRVLGSHASVAEPGATAS